MTADDEPGGFGQADGIMGLAYNVLNNAYDLSSYLEEHGDTGGHATRGRFPTQEHERGGPAGRAACCSGCRSRTCRRTSRRSRQAGIEKNLFAFYTLRSMPSMRTSHPEDDPLNQGFFIMGGGPEQDDLYTGEFVDVDVVDDAWYNTDLLDRAGRPAASRDKAERDAGEVRQDDDLELDRRQRNQQLGSGKRRLPGDCVVAWRRSTPTFTKAIEAASAGCGGDEQSRARAAGRTSPSP